MRRHANGQQAHSNMLNITVMKWNEIKWNENPDDKEIPTHACENSLHICGEYGEIRNSYSAVPVLIWKINNINECTTWSSIHSMYVSKMKTTNLKSNIQHVHCSAIYYIEDLEKKNKCPATNEWMYMVYMNCGILHNYKNNEIVFIIESERLILSENMAEGERQMSHDRMAMYENR